MTSRLIVNSIRHTGASSDAISLDSAGKTITGAIEPATDSASDLGSTTKRWQNIYTTDLHLSNEGSKNSVDNSWGDWTLQEGKEDIFMINNRTGKKFKMLLQEVT
jgi:hypothetical protein